MRMKAEDKAKWLEALRSGEYKQIDSTLCADGRYCCLGVLETILDGDVEKAGDNTSLASPTCNFLARHNIEVELCKPRDGDDPIEGTIFPPLDDNGVFSRLMEMNDEMVEEYDETTDEAITTSRHANTFSDIADYIEKNVEVYD